MLTTSFPRRPGDWAGVFVAELANALALVGDEVEVIAPAPAASLEPGVTVRAVSYARHPRLLHGAGAPDNLLGSAKLLDKLAAWAQVPAFVARMALACTHRSRHWSAIVSHWLLPCGLIGARCARGLPHLAIAHGSDVHLLARLPAASVLLDTLSRSRTRLVLTSAALRPVLATHVHSRRAEALVANAAVVRMGLQLPPARPSPRSPLVAGQRPKLLFVGRLVPVKGVDCLIEACAGLPIELTIVGDGPSRPVLERQAQRLGVSTRFLGECTRQQTWSALDHADLFVLPSRVMPDGRADSAPLALAEALAAGLPVITTRVGGATELIDDGKNGLLVDSDSPDALHNAISRLLADDALRQQLARAGPERARSLSWNAVGPTLRELLAAL